jgi:hypothetical protein
LTHLLELAGILVLARGPVPRSGGGPARPPRPSVVPLAAAQWFPLVSTHLAAGGAAAGESWLRSAARVFSSSSVWRLTPGGSPEETAALVREVVGNAG